MRKFYVFLGLAVALFFVSCKKDDPATPAEPGEYYYTANIGGTEYKVVIPFNNTNSDLVAGSGLGGFDDVVFHADVSDGAANGTSLNIGKGIFHNYTSATDQAFLNFFTPGNYPAAQFGTDGLEMTWVDPTGGPWSTDFGTGDQTGSTFKIVSFTEQRDLLGTLYIKTKIEFSCKLYDLSGSMKTATGTFVGLFGKV